MPRNENYTRRQFLQRTAATAGALAAANANALPDHRLEAATIPANVPPSDRLRLHLRRADGRAGNEFDVVGDVEHALSSALQIAVRRGRSIRFEYESAHRRVDRRTHWRTVDRAVRVQRRDDSFQDQAITAHGTKT